MCGLPLHLREVNGAFMPLLLYAQGNRPHYPLGRSGNLNFLEPSGPVHTCTWIALPFTYCVGGWASPTASLDQVIKKNFFDHCTMHLDNVKIPSFFYQQMHLLLNI